MTDQAAHPTNTPPSLVAAVKSRVKVLAYDSGSYLGFDKSKDIYGDGTIVVVPFLPGHTPGSQGSVQTTKEGSEQPKESPRIPILLVEIRNGDDLTPLTNVDDFNFQENPEKALMTGRRYLS